MKQTGSVDTVKLCDISEDYSARAKAKARKSAATVAKDVQVPSYFSMFGSRGYIADFYMSSFMDMSFLDLLPCKSPAVPTNDIRR